MLHEEPERRVLGELDGSFGLVHSRDALAFVVIDKVHYRRHMTSVVGLAVDRRVHGVKHAGMFTEPCSNFTYTSTVGVVEVLFLTKQLNGLRATMHHRFKVIDLQTFAHAHVR